VAPASNLDQQLSRCAEDYMRQLMTDLDYVGVLAMECFVAGDRLLINELAPRVHNSGHWTLRSEATCQFENHLRAVLGLPLGTTEIRRYEGIMNVLGEHWSLEQRASLPKNTAYVDYNKYAAPRRKLAHIHVSSPDHGELHATLQRLRAGPKPEVVH